MHFVREQVRRIVGDHAHLDAPLTEVDDGTSLYDAGMTSHAAVRVMLAVEEAFDLELPDHMLTRRVFSSIDSITAAVEELRDGERTDARR